MLTVSEDGLVTAIDEGIADVTIIHGGAEEVIPIAIETPHVGATPLGMDGGIVQSSDGSLLMLPSAALYSDTTVELKPLEENQLSLPTPKGFEFADAFELNLGDNQLLLPAQLALKPSNNLLVGTEVYIMRKGSMPDETGTWQTLWLLEESGKVAADGTILTQSPPYPGIAKSGEYAVFAPDRTGSLSVSKGRINVEFKNPNGFYGVLVPSEPDLSGLVNYEFGMSLPSFAGNRAAIIEEINSALVKLEATETQIAAISQIINESNTLGEVASTIEQNPDLPIEQVQAVVKVLGKYVSGGQLLDPGYSVSVPSIAVSYDISSVKVVSVPRIGLPTITETQLEFDENKIATYEIDLNVGGLEEEDAEIPPIIQSAELKFEENKPVITLKGSNFLVDDGVTTLNDLIVNFTAGDRDYRTHLGSFFKSIIRRKCNTQAV